MKGRDDVERRKKGGSADASSPGWGSIVCEWNVYTETIPQDPVTGVYRGFLGPVAKRNSLYFWHLV